MLQLKRFCNLLLASFIIVFALSLISFPGYQIMAPGEARDIRPLISVSRENHLSEIDTAANGGLYFTTVIMAKSNLLTSLYAVLTPWSEILYFDDPPLSAVERKEGLDMMKESKIIAAFVALKKAGHEAIIQGEGVNVLDVLQGSDASRVLQKGDILIEVDGRKTTTREELVRVLSEKIPGDKVDVVFIRKGKNLKEEIKTLRKGTFKQQRAILGLSVNTRNMKLKSPIKVDVESYDIQGSSAGLMMTLGILEKLKKTDLAKGFRIAGTGTIAMDGSVGEIAGVRQKVVAACFAGAQVFFVPEENKDEAIKNAVGIRIVPVRSIDDALDFLNKLP